MGTAPGKYGYGILTDPAQRAMALGAVIRVKALGRM